MAGRRQDAVEGVWHMAGLLPAGLPGWRSCGGSPERVHIYKVAGAGGLPEDSMLPSSSAAEAGASAAALSVVARVEIRPSSWLGFMERGWCNE